MVEVFGQPAHAPIWCRAAAGAAVDWDDLLAGYAATVDWPACAVWRPLAAAKPEALVLLSTRASAEAWWTSASRTIFVGMDDRDAEPVPGWRVMWDVVAESTLERDAHRDAAAAMAAYEAHNAAVRAEADPARLLEWRPGDGWEPLCSALAVPVPDEPFPHLNTTEEWPAEAGRLKGRPPAPPGQEIGARRARTCDDPPVEPLVARKTWRTLEPYHGLVYFAAEPAERYAALGLDGQDGYFASRSAPMGRVGPEVVVATFFNFNPALVRRALPAAWERTSPEAMLGARLAGMDAVLRRVLGEEAIGSADVARAAELARSAAERVEPAGRPLAAAHAALAWPEEPHLALWHAISVLREHRGDGHVACLVAAGLDGPEALVVHAAGGEVPAAALQTTRGWSDDAWRAALQRLADRDWVDADGALTEGGRARRDQVEARTDELAVGPWAGLGEDGCTELRSLVRPLSRAIVEGGSFGFGPSQRAQQSERPAPPG